MFWSNTWRAASRFGWQFEYTCRLLKIADRLLLLGVGDFLGSDQGDAGLEMRLFQSPMPTAGHRVIRVAALLGAGFVAAHLATLVITCIADGFSWGVNAWVLDILGFAAGLFFAVQCWRSSSHSSSEFRDKNVWICVWASITIGSRVVDTLMLLGIVRWDDVYSTPTGPTLWANLVSEVVLGNAFAAAAFLGSCMLLLRPQPLAE